MHPSEALNTKQPATGIHPLRFVLVLMMVSIFMIFAAYTSAYIVRRNEGNWLEFDLPFGFLVTTLILAASSVSVQWAWFAARKDELNQVRTALIVTTVLGTAFLVGQWQMWAQLVGQRIFFAGTDANPSGSFLYVLTGVHAFHLITGLIFLLIVLRKSFNYQVHSRQMLSIGNVTIYWHYLGALWLYLYLFLLLNH
ncbi:cytochrome c oxidase subunit 3 [Hymenobacter luteus]|uniref:Cytochrome c oxidase subunit 3 n=2 Tax=Hymenobacter TaxID=89966 RepID=A0A7W9SWS0_9BACT|nr:MULTISPECIES: cytochrome c oxidase subunit 3 [Hymenobacter]MBB4600378.1 cytochrome c oxidase subunit 3 [Hymenobacter latericoloratus]MBB6057312.1 cytochrome c oxidase subunit 3 [Hymenobacter luteus]